jgi:NADH-quinone oxidoreductase subunit G
MSERIIYRNKPLKITIDGQKCNGVFGQTILEIARANDIYIPTMCYLAKVSPIASCRMCIVNVEGVDSPVLSCQEKAVDNAIISTQNNDLFRQRQNIMKLYDVNHPLQCGVCDKSGECDLQNKNIEFKINSQEFAVKDLNRKKKKWGILGYDPSLCIMCEKCVHTCNEIIGANALYIKPGGYKSTIDIHFNRCEQCGDCISVCPVGAMVSNEFKYTSNAWESDKIPATCAHCSSGCALYYNVKYDDINNPHNMKITRVTNDYEFSTLCGAGRFGFNFENKSYGKNKELFKKTIDIFKISDTIKFNSYITNEEAFILQILKEKLGIKLVNEDAKNYQDFLTAYSSVSGTNLYSATNSDIKNSDGIIVLGTRIVNDNPIVKYNINQACKNNRAKFVYMHSIDDITLHDKYTQFIKYEVGSEEGVIALLASYLINNSNDEVKEYLDDLDIGYLSGETSVGEEELELIQVDFANIKNKTLIIGEDVYSHSRALNIAKLIGLIDYYTDFNVVLIPSQTNTLGVSLICTLDDKVGDNVIGYNEIGDFIIGDCKNSNLALPALNQQEGTFVSIDKKVINTNVALKFDGYCLNDIVNEFLEYPKENTVDYTQMLPINKGFVNINFDDLQNGYNKYGNDLRGYELELFNNIQIEHSQLDEIEDIDTYNGTVIYRCEPLHQFNKNTAKSLLVKTSNILIGSNSFAIAAKIKDGDMVKIIYKEQIQIKRFRIDTSIRGTVALYPTFDDELMNDTLVKGYRFKQVQIERQEV